MRRLLGLLLIALLSACDQGRSQSPACAAPLVVPEARLLLFGEVHGSAEAPALIARVACSSALKMPTAIGLEIPTSEQAAIDTFLLSNGSDVSKETLLSGQFWQTGTDGRSSMAMADLLEDIRALREQGVPLTVFAFDAPSALDRDAALAGAIRDFHLANPELAIIALMGNVHASQRVMQRRERLTTPSGALLEPLNPTSVLIVHRTGTTWACMPDCDVHDIGGHWGDTREDGWIDVSPMPGYDLSYVLPGTTASPPAVASEH